MLLVSAARPALSDLAGSQRLVLAQWCATTDIGARLPRLDHRVEGLALVLGVALDRFHQVGDEVVTPLQLHVDAAPGILRTDAQTHQAVIDDDKKKPDHQRQAEQHDESRHFGTSGSALSMSEPAHDGAALSGANVPPATIFCARQPYRLSTQSTARPQNVAPFPGRAGLLPVQPACES